MAHVSRRLGIAALTATTCLVVVQLSAAGSAGASSASPDGGPAKSTAAVSLSQVPYQVRNHAAKLAGHLKSSQPLRLAIDLKSRDQAGQKKLIAALQDKKSPLFHKYLTAAQWNARFAPTAASEAAVVSFAKSHGLTVTKRWPNRLIVDVQGTAAQIESAFHVTLNDYTVNGKTFFANANEPTVPDSLSSIVSSVDGLNNLNRMVPASGMTDTTSMPRYSGGPLQRLHVALHKQGSRAALAKAVKAKGAHPNAAPGIYEPTDLYSSQSTSEDALQKQSGCCNPFHNPSTSSPAQSSIAIATAGSHFFSTDIVNGWGGAFPYLAYNINEYYIDGTPTSGDYEGTMDTEWSLSMANSFGCYCDTAHIYVYSGANAQFSTFHDIYNAILTNNTAKIVSSSWGCAEVYCISTSQMSSDHTIYDAMIAQGFTLLNSSGDRGAYADCSHVSVSNPASDPDWLGIGATNLELTAGPVYASQTAWGDVGNCSGNGGGSGGGCSAYWGAPSYQTTYDPNYFCGTASGYSANYKSVPDVSLNGDWANSPQYVYYNGSWSGNGGTSISAPMMAGFYAQQNSYGIELGSICGGGSAACAPIGQAGLQLYKGADIHAAQGKNPMYDITSGCTSNEIGSGYCGITGYDRAAGWGTPNWLQLAWANNYWNMPEASPPSISLSGPSTSGWVNSGSISWNIVDQGSPASGVAGYTAKWDGDPGDQASETTPGTGASFYSGPASAHGASSGSTSLLVGCHTLYVRAWDNIGESAVNSYGPVCYDNTAPSISNLQMHFRNGRPISNTGANAPVRVSWSASDALSGVANPLVWLSTDSASFVEVATTGSGTYDTTLAPGHNYQFAVGVYDNAGNFSGYAFTGNFNLKVIQESAAAVTYSTGWKQQHLGNASSKRVEYTKQLNKTASVAYTGSEIAWVSFKDTDRGSASVSVDGGSPVTVNTNAASQAPRAIVFTGQSASGAHTLLITNQATAGHPRIDVDAFMVFKPVA